MRHSSQSSVNLRAPFCIFLKKSADLAAGLHASSPHDLAQGEAIQLLFSKDMHKRIY